MSGFRRMLLATAFACSLGAVLSAPSLAQMASSIGSGSVGGGVSSALVCLLSGGTGCTMTGAIRFGSGASLQAGTASQQIGISDTTGTTRGSINATGTAGRFDLFALSTTGAGAVFDSAFAKIGNRSAVAATAVAGCVADNTELASPTCLLSVYGEGVQAAAGGAALVIGAADITTSPLGASTGCRMSSAAATTWVPSEAGAVDKMHVCCTNTGTFAITMTTSAGAYQGPTVASVVGQFDNVCFEYVTDRWVERSFKDNA